MVSVRKSPNMMSTTGPQARHGGADADAGKSGFGNRRIDHALGAEFFHQTGEHFEWRPGFGHVFAENADARVAAHLFRQRFPHCLRKCEFTLWHKSLQA